jgi:ABC-type phosphate transport system ATPase subunit
MSTGDEMPTTAIHPEPVLRRVEVAAPGAADEFAARPEQIKIATEHVSILYGEKVAVRDVSLTVQACSILALIGPSGSGKSTFLRCFNRMNDLIPGASVQGQVCLDGENVMDPDVSVVELRRRVGMVFQRPNPFPMSIYENVAYGPRRRGQNDRRALDSLVETSLKRAALWDESRTTSVASRVWRFRAASSNASASPAFWRPIPRSS